MRVLKKIPPYFIAFLLLLGATPPPKMGPLRVSKVNPRYFEDGSGKIVYLTGSHTWTNLQDGDERKPPFDFNAYLRFLVEHNHNFIRMWSWQSTGAWIFPSISPHPWLRTGPGLANDGKPKFNLKKFNPEYFKRLRERVELAKEKGIYVSVMLFVGGNFEVPAEWRLHPFNKDNNVNGIDGDVDGDGRGKECVTLSEHPKIKAVREIELAYIRKVIDTLNDLDNVLYEICNEAGNYSTEWQYHLIHFIKSYETEKSKQHPVGMTFQYGGEKSGSNANLFNSPADWISPNPEGGYREDPPVNDGRKVVLNDTDHLWGEGGNPQWVWKSFTRGHNPLFMDRIVNLTNQTVTWAGVTPAEDILQAEEIRKTMGSTVQISKRFNIAEMLPLPDLASTRYCLAKPGETYIIYIPSGGEVKVDLRSARGRLKLEWMDPINGSVILTDVIQGGGWQTFKTPFMGDAVLLLYRETKFH